MAKPNPERELERLQRALRAGTPPVVAIVGEADFFRREALELVLASIDERAELRTIDGGDDTDGSELHDLRGASLFGVGCWLVVRRAAAWLKAHGAALETALAKRADQCGIVIEIPKLDRRTKLSKVIEAAGEVFEFRELYAEPFDRSRSPLDAELVGWVAKRAKRRSIDLTLEAAFLMVTTVGHDLAELCAELDRLSTALDDRRRVDPQVLQKHLTCSFESTPFEFADAVLAHDRRRAMRSLHAMFARGVRGRDGAAADRGGVFPFVTAWMFQCLRNVYEGRRLIDSGVAARDVPGRLGVRTFVERFQAQLEQSSMGWLQRALHELHDCQRQLRRSGEDPELLLEGFLARCLGDDARRGGAA